MKKKLFGLIALVITIGAISFYSCSKEKNNHMQSNNVAATNELLSVKEGRLAFKTVAYYEETINNLSRLGDGKFDEWENKLGFQSMRKMIGEESCEKLGVVDPLLATLLNKEGVIEIEGNIYQINLLNETVKVTSASTYAETSFLKANNYTTYSTNDNVFEMLNDSNRGLGCSACAGKSKEKNEYLFEGVTVNYKVVYQKAGIYYSLQAKIKKDGCANSSCNFDIGLSGSVSYNQCGGGGGSNTYVNGGSGREYSWRPYEGSRRLKQFSFYVSFSIQGLTADKDLRIDC